MKNEVKIVMINIKSCIWLGIPKKYTLSIEVPFMLVTDQGHDLVQAGLKEEEA